MATFKDIADKLEAKLETISNFKIGKTGRPIGEKYHQEYAEIYDFYEVVGYSPNEDTIDKFEMYLIDRFQGYTNCDNNQVGGAEMSKSNSYLVYFLYNNYN